MAGLGRSGWSVRGVLLVAGALALGCGGKKGGNPPPTKTDGSVMMGDTSVPVHRTSQMLTASSDTRGQARISASASEYADLLLIDSETQKPVAGARIEALGEEEGDSGFFVRVSKDADGYRPEVVRVQRGAKRTVPLAASTPDVPGRAVRVSQRVYDEEYMGEADLAGVSQKAAAENRPDIVFVPVLDKASMMSARFHMYRSPLPATMLAMKVEGARPASGSSVKSRARVVSTSGPRRSGARVQPGQLATAGERRDEDGLEAPLVSSLLVAAPDGNGDGMVSWGVQDPGGRVLAFEVGVDTTKPTQRVAPTARSLAISVRQGEHFVCVRPVFSGSDLESEIHCELFDASEAPPAANVRVRVRPMAADMTPRRRQPMPVEVEVENLGSVDAAPFKVDVVLSRDGRPEGGLGEVRTVAVDGVPAGRTAVRRTAITPPRDGSLYVVARADSSRQLVETNAEDNLDRLGVTVMPTGDNHSPVLSVAGTTVAGGAGRLVRGQFLRLQASADDMEDGDLTSSITWISSRDGQLTTGASLETNGLTPGTHRVRALVSDRGVAAALRPPTALPWWRLFSSDPLPGPSYTAAEPPETVSAEFSIEVVEPEAAMRGQSPPAVSAGPDLTTTVGGTVVPLASASDPDGDQLTFTWTAKDEAGNPVAVQDAGLLYPRFAPAAAGRYRLSLSVSDGSAEERDDLEVLALAPAANRAPLVTVTLPQSGQAGTAVRATVTASDEDGDGLSLSYSLIRPEGSAVLLVDGETLTPGFVPDLPGIYKLKVTADDGRGRSAEAEASTQVVAVNPPDGGVDGPQPDAGQDTGPPVPQPIGAACGARGGCLSGNCVNGVCCDTPCLGLCNSCTRSGQVGVCGPVATGQDPRDDCPSSGTCNAQSTCSPMAVRPGAELLAGGPIDLLGLASDGGDPEELDRKPAACDPGSGLCAFLRPSEGGQTPGLSGDLFVVDARAPSPVLPRLVATNVNPYGSFGEGGRPGFVRGTLLYASADNDVYAWRSGWTNPHHLAGFGWRCSVSRNGRYAACVGNHRPVGEPPTGENYDLALGSLSDGGSPLPFLRTYYRAFSDAYTETPVFSPDGQWLALLARLDEAAFPGIELQPLPSGAPVTVLAENDLELRFQFSPDARWIAFLRGVTFDQGPETGTLAVADLSSDPTVRNLEPGTQGFGWYHPPGGPSQLMMLSKLSNPFGSLGRIADLDNPQLVTVADKVLLESIVFDPAAGKAAGVRDTNNDQRFELWAIDLMTGALTELASPIAWGPGGRFSPDGSKLAWATTATERTVLNLSPVAASAGPPLPLGEYPNHVAFTSNGALLFTEGFAYSPAGRPTGRATYYGQQTTLRLHDGISYPPRALQPNVRDHFAVVDDQVLFVIGNQGASDGLYRFQVGSPPPPITCDPLQPSSCGAVAGCRLRGPGDVTACTASGAGTDDAPCGTDAACAPSYQCHAESCRRICASGGSACPPAAPYCQVAPGNASLGLCFPAPPPSGCDPVRGTGCLTGLTCQVAQTGQHSCATAGGATVDQPCQGSGDCAPGLGCFSGGGGTTTCRPYCDTRGPSCGPNSYCNYIDATWVGYCSVPVGPPPACNPVTQTGCAEGSACYAFPGGGGTTGCELPGTVQNYQTCNLASDCARGLGCFDGPDGRRCRPHCYFDSPESCPGAEPYCNFVGGNYGFCTPFPPPMPTDGGATGDGGPSTDGGAQL
jgi:hypothetical protein